jgi:hypothetical protein
MNRHSDLHDIGCTLTTFALDALKLPTELGRQDLEDEPVRVLINERPVKVEHDELFASSGGSHLVGL